MLKESILKLLKLDSLVSNLTGYVETRLELMKLEVKEEIAKALARISVLIVVISALTLFVLFFSVSIALLIGEALGYFAGFGIVTGFYFLIFILFLALRGSISLAIEKKLIEKLRNK